VNTRKRQGEPPLETADRRRWEWLLGDPVTSIQAFRGNWLLTTSQGRWVAKPSRPEFLRWWSEVDRELRHRGFMEMPRWVTDGRQWQVTSWVQGRSARYGQMKDLTASANLLGRFHRLGRGMYAPTLSPGRHLVERVEERFYSFVRLVRTTPLSSPVRKVLEPVEGELLQCGQQILDRLVRDPWADWCRGEQRIHSLVHRDLASHNWIFDEGGRGWLIDFDAAGYDSQVGDLWQLLSRAMWEQKWDASVLNRAVASYERERPLSPLERELLRILLPFPNEIYREALGLNRGDPDYALTRTLPYLNRLVANMSYWRPWFRNQTGMV
jgi:CotS family spore coat protein